MDVAKNYQNQDVMQQNTTATSTSPLLVKGQPLDVTQVSKVVLGGDSQVVELSIANLAPTWCMEINYSLKTADGKRLRNKIHNTIHVLGE